MKVSQNSDNNQKLNETADIAKNIVIYGHNNYAINYIVYMYVPKL